MYEKKGSRGKDIWRCEVRKGCKARINVMMDGKVNKEVNEHSHAPEPMGSGARGLKRKIRNQAI